MLEKRIIDFIQEHHLLTLSTSKENIPYSSNMFYVYNKENNSLIFSSDIKTKHAKDFIENSNVAASIALETKDVKKIQGHVKDVVIMLLKAIEVVVRHHQEPVK